MLKQKKYSAEFINITIGIYEIWAKFFVGWRNLIGWLPNRLAMIGL